LNQFTENFLKEGKAESVSSYTQSDALKGSPEDVWKVQTLEAGIVRLEEYKSNTLANPALLPLVNLKMVLLRQRIRDIVTRNTP